MRSTTMLKSDGERFRFLMWNGCAVNGDTSGRVAIEWWDGDDHFKASGYTLRDAVDNAILYAIPDSTPPDDF